MLSELSSSNAKNFLKYSNLFYFYLQSPIDFTGFYLNRLNELKNIKSIYLFQETHRHPTKQPLQHTSVDPLQP